MARRNARLVTAATTAGVLLLTGLAAGVPVPRAVGEEPTVRFVAAADFAANTNTRAVLATMDSLKADLALALGDLSYGDPGAEQAWCDLVTSVVGAGFPFELVAGNHESNGTDGAINDFSACLPNQLPGLIGTYGRQWYVDVPAQAPLVRFVMISPALTFPDGIYQYTAGSPRYDWTAAAIDGARTAAIPWVVVGMHKTCLSMGEYGCDYGPALLNMLVEKKVDLVLTGHEHLYQRTKQLALGAGCTALVPGTFDADCVVDADADLVRGAGTVIATVGTGGQTQRPVYLEDTEAGYFAATSGLGTDTTWGPLDVQVTATTLTAAFARALGGSFTDAFTIGPPGPGNLPPVASFTSSCTDLTCTFDGSGSSDPDGTVAGYSWDFGDGLTGTGATVEHQYATAGAVTAALTVTDNQGASSSTTRTVNPTSPAGAPFAADAFTRSVTNGLGTADVGGAWATTGSTANYSVAGGTGNLRIAAGSTLDLSLPGTSSPGTDLSFGVSTDKPMTGGGIYLTAVPRRVPAVGDYRVNVRLRPNGVVALGLARSAGSAETALVGVAAVTGLNLAVGEQLMIRAKASGVSPTVLQARVWKAGTPEPTTWQVSYTDATAGLQVPGRVGARAYLSSSATNSPVTLRMDDLVAVTP